ncbi:MAG: hypothetical protein PHX09_03145 [Clostridia bacterium]|nr:hypothetical protein [Clostridia bacterium]
MEYKNNKIRMYNITKMIIAILLLPTIFIGVFCSIVIFNTKNMGFPSALGYTVVQIPNNDFYNSETDTFKNGEYRMFHAINAFDYKEGDLIAYHIPIDDANIVIDRWEWLSLSPLNPPLEENNINSANKSENTQISTIAQNSAIQNMAFANFVYASSGLEQSNVALGKIAKIGIAYDENYDENNVSYTCFSIYDASTDTTDDNMVLAPCVLGVGINSSDLIIDFMLFSSSTYGFMFLIIFPCLFLIILQITNLTTLSLHQKEVRTLRKDMLREREKQIQREEIKTISPRFIQKTDMERVIDKSNRAALLRTINEDKEQKSEAELKVKENQIKYSNKPANTYKNRATNELKTKNQSIENNKDEDVTITINLSDKKKIKYK